MIISCPNCDTAYNLSENAITSEGRKIRCKRCRHVFWARRLPSPAGSEPKIEIYYKDQEEAKKPAEESPQAPQTPQKSTPSAAPATAAKSAPKLGVPKPLGAKPSLLKPPGTTGSTASDAKEEKEADRAVGKFPRPGQVATQNAQAGSSAQAGQPKKLSSLFGSTLKSKAGKEEENQQPAAPRFGSGAPLSKPATSHETSFGMPAITERDRDNSEADEQPEPASDEGKGGIGADTARATSLGIPSLKNNLTPPQDPSTRKRQSTLWMLSEDEVPSNNDAQLSENLEKARISVAEKLADEAEHEGSQAPSEADFSDILDAQNDPNDDGPDPSNQTSPLLNFDRENLRKSFGGSPLAQQLAQNLAAKKPWPEAKDQTTNFDRDEESGRRNTTLFGLAAPISSNTTRYGEEDAAELFSNDVDLDDFFNLDDIPPQHEAPDLDAPIDYDKHPSNADSVVSVAYTEPLKPSEKDTARRLAKFLGRMSAAKKEEEELLDPSLETIERTVDITRDVSRDFASFPTESFAPETATATTRDERPPFGAEVDPNFGSEVAPDFALQEDPIQADLSAPISPLHGHSPAGPPPSRGPAPQRNSMQGQPFGAPPSYDFGAQQPPAHFQQHSVQNNAWNSGERPPANFSPTVNNGPLFDQIESTDIIPRESPEMQNISKPAIGNILMWGGVIAIVILVGLFVAWFIVMKLL